MILALDSSQNSGSIALQEAGQIVYSSYFDVRITHSETLLPEIDHALKLCGYSPQDLEAIVLAIGPGSFTGLRIGLATAKGIAYGREIPIYTFDSLLMTAFQGFGSRRKVLSVIDAKMSEYYGVVYDSDMRELVPPRLYDLSELVSQDYAEALILGSASVKLAGAFKAAGISFYLPLAEQSVNPAVALLGLHTLFPKSEAYDFETLAELEPYYLRESTAQIKRNSVKQN